MCGADSIWGTVGGRAGEEDGEGRRMGRMNPRAAPVVSLGRPLVMASGSKACRRAGSLAPASFPFLHLRCCHSFLLQCS